PDSQPGRLTTKLSPGASSPDEKRRREMSLPPPPSDQLRRLFSPPFWPASDARCGLFLKLPPLFCPPFFPASDARLGSSAKLPLPPRCSVISVLPFRFEVNSGFHQWNSLLIGRRNWNSFRSFFISNNHHFITEYNVTQD